MSDTFLIKNTANTLLFSIKPGALDGPSGASRHTDLRLYGLGVGDWGEGVDQNLYHLLEHSACPAKVLGDYNPTTGLFDYNPAIHPILPKCEQDLGPGNGITTSVVGQLWFNTTDQHLYSRRVNGWVSMVGGLGSDLDAEYLGGIPAASYALISYNDSSNATTLASARTYTDQQVLTLSQTVSQLDAAQTLALTNHTNTTAVSIHGSSISAGANTLMHRDSNGRSQVAAPSVGNDIVNKTYADTIQTYATGVQTNLTTHINTTGTSAHGATASAVANTIIARNSSGRAQVAAPTSNSDIATKKYVDDTAAAQLTGNLPALLTGIAAAAYNEADASATVLSQLAESTGIVYAAGTTVHMRKNTLTIGNTGNIMASCRAIFPGTYRFWFEYSSPGDYDSRFDARMYINGVARGVTWYCSNDGWTTTSTQDFTVSAGDLIELRCTNSGYSGNAARNFRMAASTSLPGNVIIDI